MNLEQCVEVRVHLSNGVTEAIMCSMAHTDCVVHQLEGVISGITANE